MADQDAQASEWDPNACQSVLEHTLGFYTEVGQEAGAPYLRTVGTGTLIEYEGWRAILTARHVISMLISKEDRIHYLTHKDVLGRHAERMRSGRNPLGTAVPRWDGGNRVGLSVSDPMDDKHKGAVEGSTQPDIGVILLNQRMAVKLNGERFYELTQGRRTEGAHPEAAEGKWSVDALTAGSIGQLDDGLCLDQDGERVSRSTVVPVLGPSGETYEKPAGRHQYQYRKLMMNGPEYKRLIDPNLQITSYAGLSGSGVWRKNVKDAGEDSTEILLSGVIIEEEPSDDSGQNSGPTALVYHAGPSLFGLVEMMFRQGISPDW